MSLTQQVMKELYAWGGVEIGTGTAKGGRSSSGFSKLPVLFLLGLRRPKTKLGKTGSFASVLPRLSQFCVELRFSVLPQFCSSFATVKTPNVYTNQPI